MATPTTKTEHTSYGDLSSQRKTITMIGVLLAMLLSALDQTIVGTALPRIARDLGGFNHYTWVVTAYLLASTVTVPIYGKLSDLFGRKWFFFSGIVIFLVGSVLCGLSHSMTQLIIFRGIQGIGGGAIMGNAFAIVGDLFTPIERGKWQGIMGGVFGLSSVIGPALGGFLTDHASWHWVFYVNLPLGIIALAVIGYLMPHVLPHPGDKTIDYAGAGLLVTTLTPLMLALVWGGSQYAWGSAQIIGLFATAIVSLAALLVVEHRAKQPIMPLDLFKNRTFTVSVICVFLTSAALFGAVVYIPLFSQLVQGASATNSGAVLTPLMVGLIISSVISGQLISRFGRYKYLAIIGLVTLTIGLTWLATVGIATTSLGLILRMLVTGAGLGLTMPIFNIAIQNAFPKERLGVVTASSQLFRGIGGTVGTAVLGGIFTNALKHHSSALASNDFPTLVSQYHLTQLASVVDPTKLQYVLSSDSQHEILAGLAKLPMGISSTLINAFHSYVTLGQSVFAESVTSVFTAGAFIAGLGLVIAFALPETPLKGRHVPPAEESGADLAAGLGQAGSEAEPKLLK